MITRDQKCHRLVRSILETQYSLAVKLLTENRDKVEMMAQMLLEKETIDVKDIDYIMSYVSVVAPSTDA